MAASVLRQWVRVQLLDTGKYVNNCKLGPIKKNDYFLEKFWIHFYFDICVIGIAELDVRLICGLTSSEFREFREHSVSNTVV